MRPPLGLTAGLILAVVCAAAGLQGSRDPGAQGVVLLPPGTQVPPPPPPPGGQRPDPAASAPATAAISGLVVDASTGAPVANAVVATGAGPSIRRQLTDAKGRFVIRGLPAIAGYTVSATKPGYFDARYGPKSARLGKTISLTDGQWVRDVRIEMIRPGAIAGLVVDERGEPVVGVYVRVLAQMLVGGRPHLVAGGAVKTDDRGAYRLAGLPEGTFYVNVPSV